jgi:hypothetical protein
MKILWTVSTDPLTEVWDRLFPQPWESLCGKEHNHHLTFADAGFLAEVVALWALALEASKSVDAVSTLAEAW